MQRKSLVLLCLGGATLFLAAGGGIAQERLAPVTISPSTLTFSFGMLGLGTTQTARLNVVNMVRTPPPILVAIAQFPCKVELDLYDDQGKLLKQKTITNLGYGQADFLDLARSEIAAVGTHVEISAAVKVGSNQSFFCSVTPTLEVFDGVTGATMAILENANSNSLPRLIFSPLPLNPEPAQ